VFGGAEAFQHRRWQALRIALVTCFAVWFGCQPGAARRTGAVFAAGRGRRRRGVDGGRRLPLLQARADLLGLLLDAAARFVVEVGLCRQALRGGLVAAQERPQCEVGRGLGVAWRQFQGLASGSRAWSNWPARSRA